MAQAVELKDKFTEETIGFVLVTEKNSAHVIAEFWKRFQTTNSSNSEKFGDIWDFVNTYPKKDFEVLEIGVCQP